MKHFFGKSKRTLCAFAVLMVFTQTVIAQFFVVVSPPKTFGQKAAIKLAMKNDLPQTIESARAVCFLLDDHGTMIGQSTKWVIGQNKTSLEPGATNSFNFVITTPHSFTTTNLTAKVSFNKLVLDGGKSVDVHQFVRMKVNESE